MLLCIADQPVVITAAHVIKGRPLKNIQIIAANEPTNYRFAPATGNFSGGEVSEELDVGFLCIDPSALPLLAGKQFLSLDDLDLSPTELGSDLAILFGMPETERKEPIPNVHSFRSFTFMTNFPTNLNWTAPQNRSTIIPVEYDRAVEDVFTGQRLELPRPNGMSGGVCGGHGSRVPRFGLRTV
jgi:hypothetical protein